MQTRTNLVARGGKGLDQSSPQEPARSHDEHAHPDGLCFFLFLFYLSRGRASPSQAGPNARPRQPELTRAVTAAGKAPGEEEEEFIRNHGSLSYGRASEDPPHHNKPDESEGRPGDKSWHCCLAPRTN